MVTQERFAAAKTAAEKLPSGGCLRVGIKSRWVVYLRKRAEDHWAVKAVWAVMESFADDGSDYIGDPLVGARPCAERDYDFGSDRTEAISYYCDAVARLQAGAQPEALPGHQPCRS